MKMHMRVLNQEIFHCLIRLFLYKYQIEMISFEMVYVAASIINRPSFIYDVESQRKKLLWPYCMYSIV